MRQNWPTEMKGYWHEAVPLFKGTFETAFDSSEDTYLSSLLWWSIHSIWSNYSFMGVQNAADKLKSFVQFDANDWPGSYCIEL